MFKDQMQQDVIMVLKFPSNSPVTHVAANTLPHLSVPAAVTVTCSRLFAVNRWHNTVGEWTTHTQTPENTGQNTYALVKLIACSTTCATYHSSGPVKSLHTNQGKYMHYSCSGL